MKLSSILPEATKTAFDRQKFSGGQTESKIVTNWHMIVGKNISTKSFPRKLMFSNKKDEKTGTLYLDVFGCAALEIQHLEPLILEKIACYLGYREVTKLKLFQHAVKESQEKEIAHSPKKSILPPKDIKISGIDDPELCAALSNLGKDLTDGE